MSSFWSYPRPYGWASRRFGCYYFIYDNEGGLYQTVKHYVPMVKVDVHSTILSSTSHTVLTQAFENKNNGVIEKCSYDFPLYDGVSVVSFVCHVGSRKIKGIMHEKAKSRKIFNAAVAKGQTAALMEQSAMEADVFATTIGNIPAGENIRVEVTYVGDLQHDAEADGTRFTIPTFIAPRYGSQGGNSFASDFTNPGSVALDMPEGMSIKVDVDMADGGFIKAVQSPSHPIEVSLGVNSANLEADPTPTKASTTLALGNAGLEKDFVLIVKAKNLETPTAILESHPTLAGHRALMLTLVPKFALAPIRPEIVFVVDRSGSMGGNISTVAAAMRVFLKSLPVGVNFNICSFGSRYSFFFSPKSQGYTKDNMESAIAHTDSMRADYGGTETLSAIKATIENRLEFVPLEIILLTDGDIHAQQQAFEYVQDQVGKSKGQIRLFPLGIGNGVSHSLIGGLARAGNGFAQSVQNGERLDARLMRMLKAALSPHVTDFALEIKYGNEDGFELVEDVTDSMSVLTTSGDLNTSEGQETDSTPSTTKRQKTESDVKTKISLFDPEAQLDTPPTCGPAPRLPNIDTPTILQAPAALPALFPFNRTTVHLLLSPKSIQRNPVAVLLCGTAPEGRMGLEIPISTLDQPGTTLHALAARKAAQDLEEGRGWLQEAKDKNSGELIKTKFASSFERIVEREAVRLGTTFQVTNRWCSFVAVDENTSERLNEQEGTGAEQAQYQGRSPTSFAVDVTTNPAGGPNGMSRSFRGDTRFGGQGGSRGGGMPRMQMTQMSQRPLQEDSSVFKEVGNRARSSFMQSAPPPPSAPAAAYASYGTPPPVTLDSSWGGTFGEARSASTFGESRSTSTFGESRELPPIGVPVPGETRGAHSFRYTGQKKTKSASINASQDGDRDFVARSAGRSLGNEGHLSAGDKVRAIIDLQDFEGYWEITERLAALLGIALEKLTTGAAGPDRDKTQQKIWATVLVLSLFEEHLQSEQEVWEMVADKAKAWLDSHDKAWKTLQVQAAAALPAST